MLYFENFEETSNFGRVVHTLDSAQQLKSCWGSLLGSLGRMLAIKIVIMLKKIITVKVVWNNDSLISYLRLKHLLVHILIRRKILTYSIVDTIEKDESNKPEAVDEMIDNKHLCNDFDENGNICLKYCGKRKTVSLTICLKQCW